MPKLSHITLALLAKNPAMVSGFDEHNVALDFYGIVGRKQQELSVL
jgi:hypothetical protein